MPDSQELALSSSDVVEAVSRGFIEIKGNRIKYRLRKTTTYTWSDPEEWVRARTIAFLIISKGYPASRIRTEVKVPRRTPNDWADIVVYEDEKCMKPYLVVENKAQGQTVKDRVQGIEQLFGNANSLRAPLGLYDENSEHFFYDVANYPPVERKENIKGNRDALPEMYGEVPEYAYIPGSGTDIKPADSAVLETRIRRSHSIIWAGGKRDPLLAFDEWSKLLFAKVTDERNTKTGEPRSFQIGTNETIAAVATRIHNLFNRGALDDPTIFPPERRISLPDKKVYDVVKALQDLSLMGTDVDTIGRAFENFFGSIFRGELGQYFTMRSIARFSVSILDISHEDYVIDPTAGSGGFLLETLLQVWHKVDRLFKGQDTHQLARIKNDFALLRVFGIEIHEILARICKINLLLHHDGHTNIEGDRSCLDSTFNNLRLQSWSSKFTKIVGNPPFGDEVVEDDEDLLGTNRLENFTVSKGRIKVPSEHVVIERAVDMLEPGGRFGFVVPDGLLNNQGDMSNCPRVRLFLAKKGLIEAIVSLPDYAFRKSGAQNKTSLLFFKKFTQEEDTRFQLALEAELKTLEAEAQRADKAGKEALSISSEEAVRQVYSGEFSDNKIFMAEADQIGFTPAGALTTLNDLYQGEAGE